MTKFLSMFLAKFLALALGISALASAASAGNPMVSARLTTGVVRLGSDVSLLIEVEGTDNASVGEVPKVDGLRFGSIGVPSREMSMVIQNGRRTTSVKSTFRLPIQPQEKGEFTIPPITVTADGQQLATHALTLRVVEDLQGEEFGLFEIDAPDTVVEGQPFSIELRFGWDSGLEAQIDYANLSLPWLGQLAGVLELDPPALTPGGQLITLNLNTNDRIQAESIPALTREGHTFRVLRVRKRMLATRGGKLEFPVSHLEFGQLERGIFTATKGKTFYKRCAPFTIDVISLPDAGRPLDYGGAVGTLHALANADRHRVNAGESIKLSVEWTGEGNLEFFEPPDPSRMDSFAGFRLYGTTDRKSFERRTVTYDLAPITDKVREIPPLSLAVFDPLKKAYVTLSTNPIPIEVLPLKNAASLALEPGAKAAEYDIRDVRAESDERHDLARPGTSTVAGALCAVCVGWVALRTLVRRRGDPDAPRERARRKAHKLFTRELAAARSASAQARALHRFLAARSGEGEQAWVGRDIESWAIERGNRAATALTVPARRKLAEVSAELDQSTWAKGDPPLASTRLEECVRELMQGGL